ncbi:BolA/IbaG family iron-sulfur metabolism protein [Gammaproteobacteria bacterium]
MENEEVAQLIKNGVPDAVVEVVGDGRHFEARVVSPAFEGLSMLAQQRMVMASVQEDIRSGRLHALSIKTATPA